MSLRVHIRPEAEADVEEAYLWYLERGTELGFGFLDEIDSAVARITANPGSNAVVHHRVRRALLNRFPYGLFYVVDGEVATVIACFHASRDPRSWRRRAG